MTRGASVPVDPSVPDAQPGAPSAPAVVPSASDRLASLTSTERHEWRMTGKLPSTSDADTTSAEPVEQVASTEEVKDPAASEPAKPTKGVTARNAELDAEIKDLNEKLRIRAQLREELDRRPPVKTDALPAVSSTAPADDPEPNPDDAAKYPEGQFDRKFFKDQAEWSARQVLRAARADWERERTDAQTAQENQRIAESWKTRVDAAKAKHTDFEEIALKANTEIPPGSLVDAWILEDDNGALVLYELQKNLTEQRRILRLSPLKQIEALVLLGQKLTAAPVPKFQTTAPPPTPTLGTRSGHADEVQSALKRGDQAAYARAANARDLAAKG